MCIRDSINISTNIGANSTRVGHRNTDHKALRDLTWFCIRTTGMCQTLETGNPESTYNQTQFCSLFLLIPRFVYLCFEEIFTKESDHFADKNCREEGTSKWLSSEMSTPQIMNLNLEKVSLCGKLAGTLLWGNHVTV